MRKTVTCCGRQQETKVCCTEEPELGIFGSLQEKKNSSRWETSLDCANGSLLHSDVLVFSREVSWLFFFFKLLNVSD